MGRIVHDKNNAYLGFESRGEEATFVQPPRVYLKNYKCALFKHPSKKVRALL